MMRTAWLMALLMLCGCEQQIRLGVEQTVSTIPDILTDHVVNNLLRIQKDQYAIIAQVSLKESVSTAINGYNYGVAPSIALRAIAVTGIAAAATNSLNENWSADPVNGSFDQYRLQLLFGFAIRHGRVNPASFRSLRDELMGYRYVSKADDVKKLRLSFAFLPDLPDGPFAEVDAPCLAPGDKSIRGTLSLHTVCFHKTSEMTGEEVASLLVLWAIAIPDISSAVSQAGASKGGSGVVVAAPTK